MAELWHNKHVQSLSAWLTLVTIGYGLLVWLTPDWFGKLSLSEIILTALAFALLSLLVLSLALALAGLGFRMFWPARRAIPDDMPAHAQEALPSVNTLTADNVTQIAQREIEAARSAEAERIAKELPDLDAIHQQRRTRAVTDYVIGLANARFTRQLKTRLKGMRDFLEAHKADLNSPATYHVIKGFRNSFVWLDRKLMDQRVNMEKIQESVKAVQLEYANNPEFKIVREGEPWPSAEAKHDWYQHLAKWEAYSREIEALSTSDRTTLESVVLNARP